MNTKTFSLDPGRRLRQATDTTSGAETRRIMNHYSDSGDSPSWINTSIDGGTTWSWERNVTGLDGNLAALQDSTGTPELQLTNLHGDVVATVSDSTGATGTYSYFESTEYGAPRDTNTVTPQRYGWLGGKQRSTDDLGGLTLMGVRIYDPMTGRFLSVDPIPGGNANVYAYPLNPYDGFDLTGQFSIGGVWGGFRKVFWAVDHKASSRDDINAANAGVHGHWKEALRDEWSAAPAHATTNGIRVGRYATRQSTARHAARMGAGALKAGRLLGHVARGADMIGWGATAVDYAGSTYQTYRHIHTSWWGLANTVNKFRSHRWW